MLKVEKIEYSIDTNCAYIYFWPEDCDFIFKLSIIDLEWPDQDNMVIAEYTENGDLFGVELVNFYKENIINGLEYVSNKEKLKIDLDNLPSIIEH